MVSPFHKDQIVSTDEGEDKKTSYLVLTDPLLSTGNRDDQKKHYFGLTERGEMLLFWESEIAYLTETPYTFHDKYAYNLSQFYAVNPKSQPALFIKQFVATDIQNRLTAAVERIDDYRPVIPQVRPAPV